MASFEGLLLWGFLSLWSGPEFAPQPRSFFVVKAFLLLRLGSSALAFLLAGLSFWRMRDRRRVILSLAGAGVFASIFLASVFFS